MRGVLLSHDPLILVLFLMNWAKFLHYLKRVWIIAIIALWWWRFLHFIVQDVPLGYDPGIYREFYLKYSELAVFADISWLPVRMQRVFPPFLGILSWVIQNFWLFSLDWLLTRWVGVQSLAISLWLYFLVSVKDRKLAAVVALLSWISFVQYEVFWWSYSKQLVWMFFLVMVLWLWARGRRYLSFPLVLALSATHRPALLVLWAMSIFWILYQWAKLCHQKIKTWERSKVLLSPLFSLIWVWVVTLLVHHSLYPGFLIDQISSLISSFIKSIDVPNLQDTYQSWWTFLTTSDLLKTNGHILVLSLIWFVLSLKHQWMVRVKVWWIFTTIRVFAQFSFYQRMMGYADLFWLIFAWLALVMIRERKKPVGLIVGWLFFLGHASVFSYRVNRTWRPIMVSEELAYFKTLPEILPADAVVMNTDSTYSAWLNWRSQRPTISPWLFDLDQRNRTERTTNRRESDGLKKCQELKKAYWKTYQNIYIWQWSKQQPNDFSNWDCFEVFEKSKNKSVPRTFYLVDLQKIK